MARLLARTGLVEGTPINDESGWIIDDPTMTQGSDATGDVYYRAASGKLTRLATTADGHVLTSTGVGAVPAWEEGGGSTEMVDHQTTTASGVSVTFTVTLDATVYKHLMIIMQGYTPGETPTIQFWNDDGTPVAQPDAGAQWSVNTSSGGTHTDVNVSAGDDHLFDLSPSAHASNHAFGCIFWLYGAGDANNYINQRCSWHGYSQSNTYSPFHGGGRFYTWPDGNSWNGSERIGKFVVSHVTAGTENSKNFRGSVTTYLIK